MKTTWDKDEFITSWKSFQRIHTRITIIFLIVLAVQAVLFMVLNLESVFPRWKTLVLIGCEIAVYVLISKVHEKTKDLSCPSCGKCVGYRFGKSIIDTGKCPHCGQEIIKPS